MKKIYLTALSLFAISINANAYDVRVEGQFGMSTGDPEIEVSGTSQDLDTDTGYSFGGGLWIDNFYDPNYSIGIQYNRLEDGDYEESAGGLFLGVPVTAKLTIENEIDIFMFNFIVRDNDGSYFNNSAFHPYLGGGIGFAKVDATTDLSITVGTTTFAANSSDDDTAFAGQFLGGFDYDITEQFYIGANVSYTLTSVDLYGADVDYDLFRAMGVIGFKF